MLLEIPAFTTDGAIRAEQFGADRLELCTSYMEGGLTPGPGLFSRLHKEIKIPIFVMIRPRGGDFVYSKDEFEVMKEEIRLFASLGADGFVFGMLNSDGSVQKEGCQELVELANEKPCTFHRAFDLSPDLNASLEHIIECGFRRILTSGGEKRVGEGVEKIRQLLERADERIIIMPGGGMKPELIDSLNRSGKLREMHASCKEFLPYTGLRLSGETEETGMISVDRRCVESFRNKISLYN